MMSNRYGRCCPHLSYASEHVLSLREPFTFLPVSFEGDARRNFVEAQSRWNVPLKKELFILLQTCLDIEERALAESEANPISVGLKSALWTQRMQPLFIVLQPQGPFQGPQQGTANRKVVQIASYLAKQNHGVVIYDSIDKGVVRGTVIRRTGGIFSIFPGERMGSSNDPRTSLGFP